MFLHKAMETRDNFCSIGSGERVARTVMQVMKPTRQSREPRLITRCQVEFERLDERVIAESEDLSRRGVFVRTDALLPVGAVTDLVIVLPDHVEFRVIARVAHLLSPSAARALGRHVGMGFEFLEADSTGRDALVDYLDDLLEELTPPPQPVPEQARIVIAEPSAPLRERIQAALEQAGYTVDAFADGTDAFVAAVRTRPDLVVAAAEMAGLDGWTMVRAMASNPRLADVPIVFTSDDASDMTRLQAYRLGVRDYIPKPFIEEELVIRITRWVIAQPRNAAEIAMLSGHLSEISLPTLLSLLEFERKSGILVVLRAREAARVFVANGRVVKVELAPLDRPPRERMMSLLDWVHGTFEFTSCEVVGSDELGLGTSAMLLEHARIRDEEKHDRGR
jgi:DNA-binding response OmpR family regulator